MDIFSQPGELLQGLGSRSTYAMSSMTSRGDYLLYLLAGLFVFIAILMLMSKKIDFSFLSKLDPRPYDMVVKSKGTEYWKPGPRFTNLNIDDKNAPHNFKDTEYSMNVECVLYNTRNYMTTEGPYRHIVHRGSDELKTTTVGGLVLAPCANGVTDPKLPPFGLPRRMNPGIFVDPNTNDLLIFVDTFRGTDNYRESVRIADIPLDIPFRLGVVLNGRVLEVYLNCKLEVTKVLSGTPKIVENVWYGIAGSAAAQAQIQNMFLWNFGLPAEDMKVLCKKLPVISTKRPICEGADTTVAPQQQKPRDAAKRIDLGLGASLSTCRR